MEGFLWGDAQRITELTQSGKYDIIFLADVIFNHSEHQNLLVSCKEMLKEDGYVLTTFSHHVTRFADRDLEFFNVAKAIGFEYDLVYKERWDEMFPEDSGPLDLRQTVNCFKLVWTGSTINSTLEQ